MSHYVKAFREVISGGLAMEAKNLSKLKELTSGNQGCKIKVLSKQPYYNQKEKGSRSLSCTGKQRK